MLDRKQSLYDAFTGAEKAWDEELVRVFGDRAGEVRNTSLAQGDEGSELRSRYDYFQDVLTRYRDSLHD